MAKTYYTVLTTYGAQLFAQAMANRQQVRITQFAVGDGNGRAVQPDSARTSLVRQVHRANISAISNDPRNNRQVIFELTIPENVGGFWIREMGIYDNNNRLVAYANCPDTYKPQLSEGSGKIQVVRMILLVSSSNAVTLSIDNSVIFVTRGQLTPKNITATSTNGFDETGHTHAIDHATTGQKGITQLTNDTGLDSETLALTAKAGKALSQRIAQNQQDIAGLSSGKVDKTAISNAVNSTSQTNVASSQAVKTAYDKAIEGKNAADNANNNANGRVSKSGDTMTGLLTINTPASYILGKDGSSNKWWFGRGDADSDDITLMANAVRNKLTLKSDRTESEKDLFVKNNKVYHQGNKPRFGEDIQNKPTTLEGYGITDSIQVENAIYNRSSVDDLLGKNKLVPINGGDRETLGFDANMYNYGLLTSLTAGQAKILLYAPHSVGQLWIRNTYGSSKFPWKRVDGADWSDVRRKPTTLEGYGITDAVNTNSLTGAIMHFAMSSAPAGWLKANGAAVSRTTYAALFAKIGTTFGAGDGRTTFNLPDLRGEFIRGWDDGRNVDSSRRLGSWQKGSIFGVDGIDASSAIGVAIKNIRSSPPLKMYEGPNIIGGDQVTFDDVEHVGLRWSGSGGAWANRNQNDGEGGFWTRGNQRNIGSNHFAAMSRPRNIALLACIKY